MIWYSEALTLAGQPSDCSITIVGSYDTKSSNRNIIEINLDVSYADSSPYAVILYSHNPSMMRQEDPSAEDILQRYGAKLIKLKNNISALDYSTFCKRWPSDAS